MSHKEIIQVKLQELDAILAQSTYEKNTNPFEIRQLIEFTILDFFDQMLFNKTDQIIQITRVIFKFFSKFQTFLRPFFREIIICEIFSILHTLDKIDFRNLLPNLHRPYSCELSVEMLKRIVRETKEHIMEKSKLTAITHFNLDKNPNNDIHFLRKIYRYYLKFLLVIFFGNNEQFSTNINELVYGHIIEIFCLLFEENEIFSDIISKQFLNLLYSRKIYSSRNISINKVTSFFRNFIFNSKYEKFHLLDKIVRTFVFYEESKIEYPELRNNADKNIFSFLYIFNERIFSPFNCNFLESFYNPTRFKKNSSLESYYIQNYSTIHSDSTDEFFKKLKEISHCDKKILNTFTLRENNFTILKELENFFFISMIKKSFGFDKNEDVKKFNYIKYLPNSTKVEIVKQLFKWMNFKNCKYSILTLLFYIYKQIFNEFYTEKHLEENKDEEMEDSEDFNYLSLYKINKILENPNNQEKLQNKLSLNKFEIRDLFYITFNFITGIDEGKKHYCLTTLLPSCSEISETLSLPFLNFLMLLNKNRKILNRNYQDEINKIIATICESLLFLPKEFEGQNFVIFCAFILNVMTSLQFKHTNIFRKFDEKIKNDFCGTLSSSPILKNDDDSENLKMFITNYVLNQINTENDETLLYNAIALNIEFFQRFPEGKSKVNFHDKKLINRLYSNLNSIKLLLENRFGASDNKKISYYDIYCRNETCQKKIKKEKILILNNFLYSCNWCGYFHLIMKNNPGLNDSKKYVLSYEVIMGKLKSTYLDIILNFNTFYNNFDYNYNYNHICLRTFYCYLNFLDTNLKFFHFSFDEMDKVYTLLNNWYKCLDHIDQEYYQNTRLTSKVMKQTQKNVLAIRNLIEKIMIKNENL